MKKILQKQNHLYYARENDPLPKERGHVTAE